MSDLSIKPFAEFVLPSNVVSKLDVSHLVSEVERIDNDLTSREIRHDEGERPVYSDQLTSFLEQNQLSLDEAHVRSDLIKELRHLKDALPILHMTFAVTADRESLQQLTEWVRGAIHPQAVIQAGLQPALVAGVYLRTPNHVHDLSLRAKLNGQHDALVKELEALRG